jgi:hypothetical protein
MRQALEVAGIKFTEDAVSGPVVDFAMDVESD